MQSASNISISSVISSPSRLIKKKFSTSSTVAKATKNSIVVIQEGAEIKTIRTNPDFIQTVFFEHVEILPKYIVFKDATEGITSKARISIRNISSKPVFVRIREPNSIAFQIKNNFKSGIKLRPGLSISAWVIYSFKRPAILRAIIPIEINDEILDYRVICSLATERIAIEPKSIDFGTIDIGYSSGLRLINVRNVGGKSTRFSIDLGTNDLEISVRPMNGVVRPCSQIYLRIELIASKEGVAFSEFWIKSIPNIRVPLKINVIVPKLVVYHPNTTGDFTLIDFPPTLENTRRYDSFVLRNLSSQVSSYVVLGEVDNELICIRDIDRKRHPVYSAFEIRPNEGRMDPFEGIVFQVGFIPTDKLMHWRQKQQHQWSDNKMCVNDFMAFIKIVRVHCTESEDIFRGDASKDYDMDDVSMERVHMHNASLTILSTSSTSLSSVVDVGPHDTMKLCLYGEVEFGKLDFEPDILYFGDLYMDDTSQRVVRIINVSTTTSLAFQYIRNSMARCYPEFARLGPKESLEVLIVVRGKENVLPTFWISFIAIADSYELVPMRRKTTMVIGKYSVMCVANISFKFRKLPETKLASEFGKISVAQDKEKTSRSKVQSTGPPIYSSSDGRYDYASNSLVRPADLISCSSDFFKPRKLINVPDSTDDEELITRLFPLPNSKELSRLSLTSLCNALASQRSLFSKTLAEILIPLSSLQIYNVHVTPTIFSFGMVALKTLNYRQLTLENRNNFSVMIRLISLTAKGINFPEGNLIILMPGAIVNRLVEFRADHIGKFNGYVDYIINDNHSYEIGVTADVVYKQLVLNVRDIVLGEEQYEEEAYRPMASVVNIKNKLEARTAFRFEVPPSNYSVEPVSGVIRGCATLCVYASYKTDTAKSGPAEMIMKCESGKYAPLRLSVPPSSPKVSFFKESIDLGEIPLNIPTRVIGVLFNSDVNEVIYEVETTSLVRGCVVNPHRGKISPRGLAILEIHLTFDACFRFTTTVTVVVQKSVRTTLKLSGRVSFPRLKFSPERIDARRVCADAFLTHLLTAINEGTTVVKLTFVFDEYPEFRVSLSPNRKDSDVGSEGITIAPEASQRFYLHFQPVDLASYSFCLPIRINDLLGPPLNSQDSTPSSFEFIKPQEIHYSSLSGFIMTSFPQKLPTIAMDYTVAGHVIFFNKLLFSFNAYLKMTRDEFIIENRNVNRETSILIRTDEFSWKDCPFSIRWVDGVEPRVTSVAVVCSLQPGEKSVFILEFNPPFNGTFSIEAPIFVRGELDGHMFNKLQLDGENPWSTIDADTPDIYFLPVPLNKTVEQKIRLHAKYFKTSSVIFWKRYPPIRFSGFYIEDSLNIVFPNGNVISAGEHTEIVVHIAFRNEFPVSFHLIVEFYVEEKPHSACPVTISATADDTLLTTHIYSRSSMDDVYAMRYVERHTSFQSITTESEDEDNFDDSQYILYLKKHKQGSTPRISIYDKYLGPNIQKVCAVDFKQPMTCALEDKSHATKAMEPEEHENDSCAESHQSQSKPQKNSMKMYYPYFPARNSLCDDHEKHLSGVLTAAEHWLYVTGFKYGFFPSIPDGITASLSNICTKKNARLLRSKKKMFTFGWSFIDVLEILVGPVIYDYLGYPKPLPADDTERTNYILQIYDKMLNFLLNQGACVAYVSPQFLLSYNDYLLAADLGKCITRKRRSTDTEIVLCEKMSRQTFESRSVQCWLDVVLQCYKCFVLGRITDTISKNIHRRSTPRQDSIILSATSVSRQIEFHERILQNIIEETQKNSSGSCYARTEKMLKSWLQYYYGQQRKQMWMTDRRSIINPYEERDVARDRTIENFDKDLCDCLALIAVTAAFCPFLINTYFNTIYICPRSFEEALHNAICAVSAWRKIRLGFIITPMQLVRPNCVQMLMLAVHLFETLPSYVPRAKVKFKCTLTEDVVRQINFTNPADIAINYSLLILNNDGEFFSMIQPQRILRLNAHDNSQVKIKFHGKKIQKIKSYLLCCGAAIGPNFGRNQVFILEGRTDNLKITSEYTIKSKLYQILDQTLVIDVPYHCIAEYEIWLSEEKPTKPSTLIMTRWSDLKTRKIPRRLFLNQKLITVQEGTWTANLSMTVACIAPMHRRFWFIFQSRLGDFIVQVNSEWQVSLTDRIVIKWDQVAGECLCSNSKTEISENCPYHVEISIPRRNKQLWNCVGHMFQKPLDTKERRFWSRYLDTYIGLRLIHWLMGDDTDEAALEFSHIFNIAVTYKVTVSDKTGLFSAPHDFTIQDVRPAGENAILIGHLEPTTPKLHEALIHLISLDGKEIRVYGIDFLREHDAGSNCSAAASGCVAAEPRIRTCHCQSNVGCLDIPDCGGFRPTGTAATGACPGPCQCLEEEIWNSNIPPKPNCEWLSNFTELRRQWSDHARQLSCKCCNCRPCRTAAPCRPCLPRSSGITSPPPDCQECCLERRLSGGACDKVERPRTAEGTNSCDSTRGDSGYYGNGREYCTSASSESTGSSCCVPGVRMCRPTNGQPCCTSSKSDSKPSKKRACCQCPPSRCVCQPMPRNCNCPPPVQVDVRAEQECTCDCPSSPECACPPSERRFNRSRVRCPNAKLCCPVPRLPPGPKCECTRCQPCLPSPCDPCTSFKCRSPNYKAEPCHPSSPCSLRAPCRPSSPVPPSTCKPIPPCASCRKMASSCRECHDYHGDERIRTPPGSSYDTSCGGTGQSDGLSDFQNREIEDEENQDEKMISSTKIRDDGDAVDLTTSSIKPRFKSTKQISDKKTMKAMSKETTNVDHQSSKKMEKINIAPKSAETGHSMKSQHSSTRLNSSNTRGCKLQSVLKGTGARSRSNDGRTQTL